MSALSPGLYRATVGGEADVIVMVSDDEIGLTMTAIGTPGLGAHGLDSITDARPLIVLDLTPNEATRVVYVLREGWGSTAGDAADQIESQIKPARIPEPGHIGSLVMASTIFRDGISVWTKFSEVGSVQWINPSGSLRQWSELIDPEPFPFGGKP